MKKKWIIYFILLLILFITSCNKSTSNKKGYIIASPEIAEIVCYLEGSDNIIGVTSECNFPAKLKKKINVGTFGKIDIEKVLELNPEIVFTTAVEQDQLTSNLNKIGIRTEKIYINSLYDYLDAVINIGKIIGQEKKAIAYADSLKNIFDDLKRKNSKEQKRVYVEIYGSPVMSVSDNSLVGEIVEIAGGNNIFDKLPRDYSKVKAEDVIKFDPEIIFITYPGVQAENIKNRKGWQNINAIQNNRIYTVDDVNPDLILRATPRTIKGIMKIQEIIDE